MGAMVCLSSLQSAETVTPEGCRVEKFELKSAAMGREIKVGVLLPPLFLLCGSGDGLKIGNRRFLDMLQSVSDNELKKHAKELEAITDVTKKRARIAEIQKSFLVDFEYRESPGGHDWPYWRDHFAAAAEFHWKHFQKKAP